MEVSSIESETQKIVCFNCGKAGHMSRQCRAPRKKSGNNKGKSSKAAGAKAQAQSGNGTPQ